MIPALERCSVILSRLLGLARFHAGADAIGFSAAAVRRLLDIVACLQLAAHRVLLLVMDELELFNVFSGWLRFQIDRLASASAAQPDELSDREATMDHGKVLAYVQGHLTGGPVDVFFERAGEKEERRDREALEDAPELLALLDEQLRRHEDGKPHMKAFPEMGFLVKFLSDKADVMFDGIATSQKRSVRFGATTSLDIGSTIGKFDSSMDTNAVDGGVTGTTTYTAISSRSETSDSTS
jgi:anaphase-promoting complex subunit 4